MPDYTSNHGYQLFADSEEDWEHRTDFEKLDADVEIRDAESNRFDHEPKANAKFVATDTGERYLGDGNSWNHFPYPSDGGDGTSGIAQGGEVVVTDGSDLQNAVNNNAVVRISGTVDVSNYSPIYVPGYTTIMGHGIFEQHKHSGDVDNIVDSSGNETLKLDGGHIKVKGIGVSNFHEDGIGIWADGYSPNISHVDIDAGYIGIQLGDRSTDHRTEPRVNWCRIYSHASHGSWNPSLDPDERIPAPSGSKGIYVTHMHDAKLSHNMIGGYDVGIEVEYNHAYLTGNHTYAYPSSEMSTGIHLGNTASKEEARYVRLIGNRVEDNIMNAGIELGDWFGDKTLIGNLIEVDAGTPGIYRSTSNSGYPNMNIAHNVIRSSSSSGGGTALDIAPRNTNSYIGGNTIDNMNSIGNAVVQSNGSPSASDHMPGAFVHDTSNDNLYYRTSSGMYQL